MNASFEEDALPKSEIIIEAETANLVNGASASISTLCSGGRKVGNLGGPGINGGVEMDFSLSTGGLCQFQVHYLSADPRTLHISIDGVVTDTLECPATRDWDTPGHMVFQADLSAGKHQLLLDNGQDYAPDLDLVIIQELYTTTATPALFTYEHSGWIVEIDSITGNAGIRYNDKSLLKQASSAFVINDTALNSSMFELVSIEDKVMEGMPGNGKELIISSENPGLSLSLKRHFYLFDDSPYILTDISLSADNEIHSNYMAPLVTNTPTAVLPEGLNHLLWVPFDNDKWVRYHSLDFSTPLSGHEVTAIYSESTREGMIIGSVEHDMWKTGIRVSASGTNTIERLEAYGGAASSQSGDVLPHGKISDLEIKSPRILLGYFPDWRRGMETFGDVNAAFAPKLEWQKGKPFGWNSWGAIQTELSYQNATEVAHFFDDSLQSKNFHNDNTVYIGLDSYWDNISYSNLIKFARECKQRGQEPGIYWSPFVDWGKNPDRAVEGASGYYYRDIYLYANGEPQTIAGAYAVDPTHPATRARAELYLNRFITQGFTYIKLDFMTHGALESDAHYDPNVHTGIQAYNQGLQHIIETLGGTMFINLSISPLFPAQYSHSRRIACDAYAAIKDTEYTLNSLTYGWWLDHVYSYNDADHIVFDGATMGENRARTTSSVITGIFIAGDDYSTGGKTTVKTKASMFLTNPGINNVARMTRSFYPVNTPGGSSASRMFMQVMADTTYLAIFNYDYTGDEINVAFESLGLSEGSDHVVYDLWNDTASIKSNSFIQKVPRRDVVFLKIFEGSITGMINEIKEGNAPIREETGANLSFYPNPVEDILQVSGVLADEFQYRLSDIKGSVIRMFPRGTKELKLTGLPGGLYYITSISSRYSPQTGLVIKK